jgi:hypothetical protein
VVPGSSQTIARWLNTTPHRAAARWQAERALSGYRRYNAVAIGRLPLPPALLDQDRPLGRQFAALAQRAGSSPTTDDRDRADALACQLLGLSPTQLAQLRKWLAGVA